ncbi:MAG: relaxase domain-containing protein, partial [Gemmataceae bacterium]|nr:relaxase domain-containing protein [Gemmataceae bacterium]
MSRVGPVPDEYQRQEKYQTEAAQCGGMEGTPAAQQKGFDPNDPAHVAAHSRHRLPDGTRPMPWHANSPTWLYGIVFAVTASVNGWLKTQPREVFDQFIEEVFKPAVRNALLVLGEAAYARQQVDGKVHRVKADLVGLTAVHATARDGNLAVHSHTSVWRWGLCPDGQLRSWHDRRFLYRHFGQALEVFHRSIAAGIEAEFGQRTEVINNRAEVPGLPQPLLETQGTRRKAALEYLAEKGVPATPESVQIAVYKTRPASQDWDLAERVPHWNREARQALGPEAGRWMKPDVGAPAAPQQPAPAVAPPLTPQPTP